MKLLALAAEGSGETTALPALTARVLLEAGRHDWGVFKESMRIPRGLFVDERLPSPKRPARVDGFAKATSIARSRKAAALLVLVDADDDCPAVFGPSAHEFFEDIPGGAVMVVREYETWLLQTFSPAELAGAGVRSPERPRDAKKAIRRLVPGYLPTTHQLDLSRRVNIESLRSQSESFDKYVRTVLALTSA